MFAFAATILLSGGYAIYQMPADVLPDLTAPTVATLVEGPGIIPTELESMVTFPSVMQGFEHCCH